MKEGLGSRPFPIHIFNSKYFLIWNVFIMFVINIFDKYAKRLEHGKMGYRVFNKMPMCKCGLLNSHDNGDIWKACHFYVYF